MSDTTDTALEFLLPGQESGGMDPAFPAPPPRAACHFEPLIDGVATFAAMERAVAAATMSVYISLWIFNPATPVQDLGVRTGGAATWADLLRQAAERGIEVRILLTDFDPLFKTDLQQNNWRAYTTLVAHAARLGAGGSKKMQVIVSRHPATLSTGIGSRLEAKRKEQLTALNRRKGLDTARLAVRPGLWRFVEYDKKTKRLVARPGVDLWASPATHHQKFLVVDETVAFCGGLDVYTGRRIDTPAHAVADPWHDVHCRLEGTVVLDICRGFVLRWNDEAPRFTSFRHDANKLGMPVSLPIHPATPTLRLPAAKGLRGGTATVQALRTLSEEDWTPVPETIVDDIERAYQRAIEKAGRFVYIENQYVRSPDLKDWLLARAEEMKELVVIVVLPVAPEEVGAKGGADEITNHGLYLQHDLLTQLAKKLGSRFGAFSMVKREAASGKPHATDSFGSRQIYVHSKTMIVDDTLAMIGSANANPRSFEIDTELNVACVDAVAVPRLRAKLWNELLGSPKDLAVWKPSDFVTKWTAIATANEKATAGSRQGFIVRHDPMLFPGKKSSDVPDAFAAAFDPEHGGLLEAAA